MIVELGAFALILSLLLSVAQTGLSAVGGARRSPVLAGAGRGAALVSLTAPAYRDSFLSPCCARSRVPRASTRRRP